jgi:hypothetical protein
MSCRNKEKGMPQAAGQSPAPAEAEPTSRRPRDVIHRGIVGFSERTAGTVSSCGLI